ncbi:hypothetical protein THIOM_005740 [Candidatus Thiomargarita nelsonii]|uniref:Uncharacterized protein n=1 Tax=Candidatus Thiomargarita nelsonii TaxID=1003181 RepID=A0A176RSE8_9GAMM|nr:hypothetical protein THIOM_005740 [Candidatus Thiomargarita nelsonii]
MKILSVTKSISPSELRMNSTIYISSSPNQSPNYCPCVIVTNKCLRWRICMPLLWIASPNSVIMP